MNRMKHILAFGLLLCTVACTKGIGETVESAYQLPIPPELNYKFSRNGESSVNTQECKYLRSPLDRLYSRYLSDADMGERNYYEDALRLYREGEYGLKPIKEVSTSTLHLPDREKILSDLDGWFNTSARIAGFGQTQPSQHRNREARPGKTGYVGIHISDKDICFVDEKGIAVAEVFQYALMGGIYLDKILNVHLSEEVLQNEKLRSEHDLTDLLPGHNYTALEHHWDLAYGYFGFWKSLAQSEGLPALKDTYRRIYDSFVRGRAFMESSRYDDIRLQADTIRHELSRVVAVRAINLLVGVNTLANLKENPKQAFRLLSQAYGLIYASQFARNAEGRPFVSYDETRQFLNILEQGDGLWEKQRLLGKANEEGSLRWLAERLGEKFGVSPKDIEK